MSDKDNVVGFPGMPKMPTEEDFKKIERRAEWLLKKAKARELSGLAFAAIEKDVNQGAIVDYAAIPGSNYFELIGLVGQLFYEMLNERVSDSSPINFTDDSA